MRLRGNSSPRAHVGSRKAAGCSSLLLVPFVRRDRPPFKRRGETRARDELRSAGGANGQRSQRRRDARRDPPRRPSPG